MHPNCTLYRAKGYNHGYLSTYLPVEWMELVTLFLERRVVLKGKGGLAMSIASHIVRTLFTIGDLKRDIGWKKPGNVDSVENLSYGQEDKWHLLDVYRPRKASGPLPVIINILEAAGICGDKKVYAPYCMYLASRGFAVVNASYRLAPRRLLFLLL